MSEYAEKFKKWLDICMNANKIESYGTLASKIGISRQTLHAWMNNPTKIKKCTIAGMMYILNVKNITLDTLCCMFGIE